MSPNMVQAGEGTARVSCEDTAAPAGQRATPLHAHIVISLVSQGWDPSEPSQQPCTRTITAQGLPHFSTILYSVSVALHCPAFHTRLLPLVFAATELCVN